MAKLYWLERIHQEDTPKAIKDRISRIGTFIHEYGFDGTLEESLFKVDNFKDLYYILTDEIIRTSGGKSQKCKFRYVLKFYEDSYDCHAHKFGPDVLIVDRMMCDGESTGSGFRYTRKILH